MLPSHFAASDLLLFFYFSRFFTEFYSCHLLQSARFFHFIAPTYRHTHTHPHSQTRTQTFIKMCKCDRIHFALQTTMWLLVRCSLTRFKFPQHKCRMLKHVIWLWDLQELLRSNSTNKMKKQNCLEHFNYIASWCNFKWPVVMFFFLLSTKNLFVEFLKCWSLEFYWKKL